MKAYLIPAAFFFLTACNKQPVTTGSDSIHSPAAAVPFKGEIYQTLDQKEVITLVSADELEHKKDNLNLVCKYTKQGETLRVVENMQGTTQAFYYKITPQGLRANEGTILYSPTCLAEAIEESKSRRAQEFAKLLVGKWSHGTTEIHYFSDGTYTGSFKGKESRGRWQIDGRLVIQRPNGAEPFSYYIVLVTGKVFIAKDDAGEATYLRDAE